MTRIYSFYPVKTKGKWKYDYQEPNILNSESAARVNAAHSLLIQEPGMEKIDLFVFQESFIDKFRIRNEPFGNAKSNDVYIAEALYDFLFHLGGDINWLEKANEIVQKLGPTNQEKAESKWEAKMEKRRIFSHKPIVKTIVLGGNFVATVILTIMTMLSFINQNLDAETGYVVLFMLDICVCMFSVGWFYRGRKWFEIYLLGLFLIPLIGMVSLMLLHLI